MITTELNFNKWGEYSKEIRKRVINPKHQGEITEEYAEKLYSRIIVTELDADLYDDAIKLFWAVDNNENILDAKFKSFGRDLTVSVYDIMTELCIDKSIDEVSKLTKMDLEKALRDDENTPSVPADTMEVFELAIAVIKKAIRNYKGVTIDSFSDDYVICDCARVTLGEIKKVIEEENITRVEDLVNSTKAGAFCKSCLKPGGLEEKEIYLVDIIKELNEKRQRNQESIENGQEGAFETLSKEKQISIIEEVLDEDVRPMLLMDGGNMEILDIVESSPHLDLYIRYLGACNGCSAGSSGTLYAIESILQRKVYENLRVLLI